MEQVREVINTIVIVCKGEKLSISVLNDCDTEIYSDISDVHKLSEMMESLFRFLEKQDIPISFRIYGKSYNPTFNSVVNTIGEFIKSSKLVIHKVFKFTR